MKRLSIFEKFDFEAFAEKLELMVLSSETLTDFETKEFQGARYNIVIWTDNNVYGKNTDITNAGQTLTVKVLGQRPKKINTPVLVRLVNPEAKLYGEYRNQLSVYADDIVPLENNVPESKTS